MAALNGLSVPALPEARMPVNLARQKGVFQMSEEKKTGLLAGIVRRKNGYRPFAPKAYRPLFARQIVGNISALRSGDENAASMVHRDRRSLNYKLRIGYGTKNEWVPNPYHAKDEHIEFATVDGVVDALEDVLAKAQSGEFNRALDEMLRARKDRGKKMQKNASKRKAEPLLIEHTPGKALDEEDHTVH